MVFVEAMDILHNRRWRRKKHEGVSALCGTPSCYVCYASRCVSSGSTLLYAPLFTVEHQGKHDLLVRAVVVGDFQERVCHAVVVVHFGTQQFHTVHPLLLLVHFELVMPQEADHLLLIGRSGAVARQHGVDVGFEVSLCPQVVVVWGEGVGWQALCVSLVAVVGVAAACEQAQQEQEGGLAHVDVFTEWRKATFV